MKPFYEYIYCVFACDTNEKDAEGVDRKDAEGVDRKDAEGVDNFIIIFGKSGPLVGVSAPDKKYLGMKYVYENYDFNFLYLCSSLVPIDDLKKCVLEKNICKNDFLILGKCGGSRMFREVNVHYLSKDTGILLTKPAVKCLYPQLHTLQEEWRDVCSACNSSAYISAFNFSISYFLKMYNIRFIQ